MLLPSRKVFWTLGCSTLLFFAIISYLPNNTSAEQDRVSNDFSSDTIKTANNQHSKIPCNCVIFRMDDLQDYWIYNAQLAVMNLFISQNQSMSLGLIMNYVGNDSRIVNKISEGQKKGLFDLALHGWDHIDYTKLNETQQQNTLFKANEKLNHLFGIKSRAFIPPEQLFDNNTLSAMRNVDLRIISSDPYYDKDIHFDLNSNNSTDKYGIYHLPMSVGFKDFDANDTWTKTPVTDIIDATKSDIAKYGFAVIMIHPQDFVIADKNGQFTQTIDESQLNDLSYLLNWMSSNHIKLSTFSKVAKIETQS